MTNEVIEGQHPDIQPVQTIHDQDPTAGGGLHALYEALKNLVEHPMAAYPPAEVKPVPTPPLETTALSPAHDVNVDVTP